MASETSGGETQILCDAARFEQFRTNPAFHRILTLMRIVNSIRFNEVAVITRGVPDSPSATRQSSAAFFYLAGLLHEGFKFADRLGKYFRHSRAFQGGFVPLLQDPDVRELRRGLLTRLRNQAVYHHDDDVIPAGLALMRESEYVLASLQGRKRTDVYYDLADIAVMHFALDAPRSASEFGEQTAIAFEAVGAVAARFGKCADDLIIEYMLETGWRQRNAEPEKP